MLQIVYFLYDTLRQIHAPRLHADNAEIVQVVVFFKDLVCNAGKRSVKSRRVQEEFYFFHRALI